MRKGERDEDQKEEQEGTERKIGKTDWRGEKRGKGGKKKKVKNGKKNDGETIEGNRNERKRRNGKRHERKKKIG